MYGLLGTRVLHLEHQDGALPIHRPQSKEPAAGREGRLGSKGGYSTVKSSGAGRARPPPALRWPTQSSVVRAAHAVCPARDKGAAGPPASFAAPRSQANMSEYPFKSLSSKACGLSDTPLLVSYSSNGRFF